MLSRRMVYMRPSVNTITLKSSPSCPYLVIQALQNLLEALSIYLRGVAKDLTGPCPLIELYMQYMEAMKSCSNCWAPSLLHSAKSASD